MTSAQSAPPRPSVDELFDPNSEQFRRCPYAAYDAVRRATPVAHHEGFDEWIVTGRAELDAVLADADRFTSEHNLEGSYPLTAECREVLARSLFFRNAVYNVRPPAHTRFRALVAPYFSPRALRRLEPSLRAIARETVRGFLGDGSADLKERFAYPFPLRVICEVLGVPDADRDMVKAWNDAWLALQVVPLEPDQQLQCAHALLAYEDYLRALLADRRLRPRDDLATGLVEAADQQDPVCTTDEAVVAVRFMVAAGHETTSNLIVNCVFQLLRQRELWDAVVREPELSQAAVEETLRFDSSAQGALRVATEAVRVGEVDLPAGARLRVMFSAAGRDPDWVEDPDSFRLDRRGPPQHLGFGQGIHFCAGAALARLEARVALETLADLLPRLRLATGFEPRYLPGGFIFHALGALPVCWT